MPGPERRNSGSNTHVALCPVKQAPEIARAFVRHRLLILSTPPERIDDGCVIASELVTNVLKHVPDVRKFHLCVSKNGPSPLIEVWDPSPVRPRIVEEPRGESGRGLLIVAALSTAWYCEILPTERGGGKIVAALL